ncbi:tripartite motif-containing protein 60-like [Pipistrellus kuhlii]|uniref:tripartite motif-containing protein 60-like n=1 Tax=Pipistrellus kuhlii TaxID=59472 RepID=UPI00174F5B26|nr:tripartite motif-containing protein 60-like [Pipistrellus kuhlii]
MAFDASLANLQVEASCLICLDHLRDPVTTECGHNFCPSCIHQRWEGLRGTFPCPVCLHHCPDRSLKRNPQLCDMMEIVQQMPTSGSQRKLQEEIPLCGKHNEVLTLFCEKNMELLCAQCRVSSDHQDQHLIPIEEAAASHRWMLKRHIRDLTNSFKNAEIVYKKQVANTWEVKRKTKKWREELDFECEEFKCFWETERQEIDNNLLIEEEDVEEKLIENGRQISYHMFRLSNLLSEIEDNCLQTDLDLLTDIERIHNSYGNLGTPAVFSCELKKESYNTPPHYLGLHKMIRTFQVDLTLDPETAHPSLNITSDRKSVTFRISEDLSNPHTLTAYPTVLSSERFDTGRHFWMVNIKGTGECLLGVCKESISRDTLISPSPNNGCWQYQQKTDIFDLFCTGEHHIGVFLDYELGEVSFYNLNNWSFLNGLSDTFSEKLMPYFSIAPSSESLTISIIIV